MMKEKGFQLATVTHEIQELPGPPKLVHLTFKMDEGPKVKIRRLEFVGNKAVSSRALKRQMKENKQQWLFSFISGRGTYQETKFEDDAEKVVEYYRDRGYIGARVGEPEIKYLDESKTRRRGGSSCASRSPRGTATRSATSPSKATRSSRPTCSSRTSS